MLLFHLPGIKIINFDKTHTIIVNVVLSVRVIQLRPREDYYLREHPAFIQGYFHDVQRRHAFLYIDKADYHDG
jgi:hypothetical protein